MKVVLLALVAAMPIVTFQAQGSKSDTLNDLVLRSSGGVTPLMEPAILRAGSNQSILLNPGVRAKYLDNGVSLRTHNGSNLVISTLSKSITVPSPSQIERMEGGWIVGGTLISTYGGIVARLATQDDTDTNLKSMQEAAKKLKSKNANNQDNKETQKQRRTRWLFQDNPMTTAELFNGPTIQQMTHLSPIGF